MELYVKLQGLKYNFRKAQGLNVKIQVSGDFYEFLELFFY
jgi:hypothetical protein